MKNKEISKSLKAGKIGVIPTDTVYGLVGWAFSREAVEKIYKVKGRDLKKGLIVLISSLDDLEIFGVKLSNTAKTFLEKHWPGKVSVVLPYENIEIGYLDKTGSGTLAFRLPDKKELIELIKEVGPLVAPSANPEGLAPAKDIETAKEYFGDSVNFYEDGGMLVSEPSTLVEVREGKANVLRKGAIDII